MKKIFMIQNSSTEQDSFLKELSKSSGIPINILEKHYSDENQIMISEHYFKNIYNYYFKEKISYIELIKLLKEQTLEENIIFKDLNNKIDIFYYEIMI